MYSIPGTRVRFREITADDAYLVCRWRNTASARDVFFSKEIVTPDSHRQFVAQRKPHDLVWIAEFVPAPGTASRMWGASTVYGDGVIFPLYNGPAPQAIGMLSLTVDVHGRTAEYGRAYLDEAYRGKGLWPEIERTLETFAFDVLHLDSIWLEIYADNQRMIDIHLRGGWRERYRCSRADMLRVMAVLRVRPDVQLPDGRMVNGRRVIDMILDRETYERRAEEWVCGGVNVVAIAEKNVVRLSSVQRMHQAVMGAEGRWE